MISRRIRHVITEIIAPWGPAVDERPPVLSAVERHAIWLKSYEAKVERRREEKRSVLDDSENKGVRKVEKREGSREPRGTQRVRRVTQDDKVNGMVEGTMVAS